MWNATSNKLKPIINIKTISYLLFFLNLSCFIFGILYYIVPHKHTIVNAIWDVFGVFIVSTLFANSLLIFSENLKLNKMSRLGHRINLFTYFMLLFMLNSLIFIFLGNFLVSISYENSYFGFFLIFLGYFGDFLFGMVLSFLNIKYVAISKVWNTDIKTFKQSKRKYLLKKILKIILATICVVFFIFGFYITYAFLLAPLRDFWAWLIGMFTFQFNLFFGFAFLIATIILLKLINMKKRPKIYYAIMLIGLFLTSILFLPSFTIPYTENQAEKDFNRTFTFGIDSNRFIDPYSQQFFMEDPFTLPEYFLGNAPQQSRVLKHIPYYFGEGVLLYYDAYLPLYGGSFLPGNNSVIVKIHGGGWTAGDKGMGNMLQVNKYLATQGYIVFDIQYGLIKDSDSIFQRFAPTPEYVKGYFTIETQVKHIASFIKKLNTTEFSHYNLNLDSVFIMGGSAGGHLAMTTALLLDSDEYESWFGTHAKIKGIIPIYPGDPPLVYAGGNISLKSPEYFYVNQSTPPCLIFQGKKDFCLLKAENIQTSYYLSLNPHCCIISFPLQGHASDLYYSGHFNQILLYYTERFLYLCNYGRII
ncbi:MAG: putative Alpha/beta hydrolase fold protein [Promethearchaeota archaeon]|nr:MAG: putative Alpha/beta hydrolase fold protein [Candidatus Lokiarchaeota archaeon]